MIAFCLGTTVIIKMGSAQYAWVTLVPLSFLTVVTFTAGWMKLFSPRAAGFVPSLENSDAAGGRRHRPARCWRAQLFNLRVDIFVTGFFLVAVAVIVATSAVEWVRLIRGSKPIELRESPFVALPEKA